MATGKKLDDLWKDISGKDGSVQHLDILTDEEKEVFKTANEINQIWVVEHAYQRQQYKVINSGHNPALRNS